MERGYLYQTIHTIGHSALYLDKHCRLLESAFMELLFKPLYLDREQLKEQITQMLRTGGLTTELSVFVELRVDMDGVPRLELDHVSIYDGYALRCISPRAVLIEFNSPFGFAPTSARRSAITLANAMAQNMGGDLAVESVGEQIYSIGGSALFMVNEEILTTPPTVESVEREVIIEAAKRCGYRVEQREIKADELLTCDELMIANHYGVTAISHFEHRPYPNDTALKIAETLAQPF